jgi:hypothetical protein
MSMIASELSRRFGIWQHKAYRYTIYLAIACIVGVELYEWLFQ